MPPLPSAAKLDKPKVVGTGWDSVVVATLPAGGPAGLTSPAKGSDRRGSAQLQLLLAPCPGSRARWGSGRLFQGTLFSAVLTDDGRVALGAVTPDKLYAALAAK